MFYYRKKLGIFHVESSAMSFFDARHLICNDVVELGEIILILLFIALSDPEDNGKAERDRKSKVGKKKKNIRPL